MEKFVLRVFHCTTNHEWDHIALQIHYQIGINTKPVTKEKICQVQVSVKSNSLRLESKTILLSKKVVNKTKQFASFHYKLIYFKFLFFTKRHSWFHDH